MSLYRVVPATAGLLFLGLLGLHAQTGARPGGGTPGEKKGPTFAPFLGRVTRVDVGRGIIMLADVVDGEGAKASGGAAGLADAKDRRDATAAKSGAGTGGTTGTGTGTGGAGTAGSGRGAGGSGGRGAGTSGDTGTGKGTTTGPSGTGNARASAGVGGASRSMTFSVAEKATITLDGKPATLKEIKVGHQVRVHTGKSRQGIPGKAPTRDAGDGRGLVDRRDANAKGADDAGRTTSAWKIEAYTKSPRKGADKKADSTRERDQDR